MDVTVHGSKADDIAFLSVLIGIIGQGHWSKQASIGPTISITFNSLDSGVPTTFNRKDKPLCPRLLLIDPSSLERSNQMKRPLNFTQELVSNIIFLLY